ncbi:hydrogenase maturation nickel metallochaperone HypA [Treponema saccharophilum]|uniref:Hydrogenase maturation factor HypA n=1 Tax=Treponema saccharophilum DSM 2985 TaxID=907348 RepID=H7EMJ3_9SPIR|nr:hydrogenase maturation nickel metallochaperone HypA [Treponema saccharophilum]EIC01278.1 hydrogenase expression/synthesis HypA [Treponema saccharophilum DSM 2985]BDC96032.1 putative hydrogenase nickel incorporation protein HypA [Treponema saccharophilum]
MHELGIVFHVIKRLENLAEENKLSEIQSVTLEIGEVSGVVPEYLQDCWKWAVKKTEIMQNSELKIEPIEAVTICNDCKKTYRTVEFGKTCPNCKSDNTVLQVGNEMNIKQIEAC